MKPTVNSQKLRELREANGWSQGQLSEMSHTSLRTIQRMEKDGNCSIESIKSVAAVFDIDFSELLIKIDEWQTSERIAESSSFVVEFQKIWFKNKAIFWTMNFAIAFLSGLLFSLVLADDKERLFLITGCIITEIVLWSLFGGYTDAKAKFIQKYGNTYSEG